MERRASPPVEATASCTLSISPIIPTAWTTRVGADALSPPSPRRGRRPRLPGRAKLGFLSPASDLIPAPKRYPRLLSLPQAKTKSPPPTSNQTRRVCHATLPGVSSPHAVLGARFRGSADSGLHAFRFGPGERSSALGHLFW